MNACLSFTCLSLSLAFCERHVRALSETEEGQSQHPIQAEQPAAQYSSNRMPNKEREMPEHDPAIHYAVRCPQRPQYPLTCRCEISGGRNLQEDKRRTTRGLGPALITFLMYIIYYHCRAAYFSFHQSFCKNYFPGATDGCARERERRYFCSQNSTRQQHVYSASAGMEHNEDTSN